MFKTISFLSLGSLLAMGCIISDSDDDDDLNGATTTTGVGTTSSDPGSTGSAETASSSGGETGGSTGAFCGWGPTGETEPAEGYVCTDDPMDAPDPKANPRGCPDIDLEVGGDCGGIDGIGCCDDFNDVWFCTQETGTLAVIECSGAGGSSGTETGSGSGSGSTGFGDSSSGGSGGSSSSTGG